MQLVYVYTILKIRLIDVNGLKKFYMNNLFISIKRLWKPPPPQKNTYTNTKILTINQVGI